MMDKNYDSAKSSGKKWEDLRSRFDNLSRVPHASVNSFKEKLDVLDQMNVNSQELSDSTESDVSAIIEELKKKSRQEFVRSNENLGIKTLIPRNSVPLKSSSMVNLYPKQGVHPSMMDLNPMLRMSDGLQTDNFQPLSHLEAYNQFLKPGDMKGKMPEEGIFERPLNGLEQKEALKNLLSNAVGADEITPKEKRLKTPEGLKITLLEHQKLGLEWMLKMETGSNKGGILADDMGLGKTIQSISIILQNPSSDRKMRPTLIIAPTSLILQWKQEILERVSRDKLRVTMYYGANRIKDPKAFNNFDIILTSYGTVAGEWPKEPKKKKEKLVLPGSDSDSGEERVMRHMAGPLFRATFYRYVALFNVRIILDEAHSIKNKGTRSSKAVSELDAQFRWCLTGTPIQNGISELYSLLRFLKIRPYNDWTEWRTRIEEPFKKGRQKLALRRIQTVMTAVCLRRRKTDSLDGLPLIQLPDRNIRFENLTFSNPEKEFYDALEKRIQLKFNSYVEAGTVMKNYTNILLLLLRLRQAACHPNLVSKDFERSSQVNADESMALAQKMEKEIVDRLVAHQDLESQECPICFDS
jgi:SNF2 family DNA or RNA helicase